MSSTTLPHAVTDRDLDLVQIEDWSATISNIRPDSPLLPVTSGALLQTVIRVRSTFPGFERNGTAFHVGGGVFVSAAHNFHERETSPWSDCTSAQVLSGGAWHDLAQWAVFKEFKEDADFSFDFAICVAPSLRSLGATLQMTDGRPGAYKRPGEVAGFPRENGYNGEKLYRARGRYSITNDKLFFEHKSSTLAGASGGPLLNDNGVVVGVHTIGDRPNRATALYPNLISFIRKAITTGVAN